MRRSTAGLTLLVVLLLGTTSALAWKLYQLGAFTESRGSSISVRLQTDPPGAMLSSADGARALGTAPMMLRYAAPTDWESCISYNGVKAEWPDGTLVLAQRLELCPDGGTDQEVRIARPDAAKPDGAARRPSTAPPAVRSELPVATPKTTTSVKSSLKVALPAPTASPESAQLSAPAPSAYRHATPKPSPPRVGQAEDVRFASEPVAPRADVTTSVQVWVNKSSHVYHCPGTRYFGNTVRGAYMLETEARADGNRPAYGRVCGPLPSSVASSEPVTRQTSGTRVWVNTRSHVYHCPGTRYYGNTANGMFTAESDAVKAGNRPAYGRSCG